MDASTPAPAAPSSSGTAGLGDAIKAGIPEAEALTKPETSGSKSTTTVSDKTAVDRIKTDNAAEKAVIQKIKVGDMEYDETTLQQMIEKAKGADKKFLEANKAKKEAIRFFKMAKENPKEFLAKTGMDPKKFAYDEVAQDLKNKLRDPKEVELEEAQKRLKEYEEKEATAKQKAKEERLAKEAQALEQKLHAEMIDALEAFPELPKNGHTVAQLARAIQTVRDKTGILLTAREVAPMVVNDIRQMVAGIVKGSSAEQLVALIGDDGMAVIRKHDLAKLKNPLSRGQGATSTSLDGEKPKQKRWKSSHDFWKTIDKAAKDERGE